MSAGYIQATAAFQEYLVARDVHVAKIPSSISVIDAATIPHTFATSFLALFSPTLGLGLPLPPHTEQDKSQPILIWGGSSSAGSYAIQTLGALGFQSIYVVAGSSSFGTLSSARGVKGVYDRKTPTEELVQRIQKDTQELGGVQRVYATMADEEGWSAILGVFGQGKGVVGFIMPTGPTEGQVQSVAPSVTIRRVVVLGSMEVGNFFPV